MLPANLNIATPQFPHRNDSEAWVNLAPSLSWLWLRLNLPCNRSEIVLSLWLSYLTSGGKACSSSWMRLPLRQEPLTYQTCLLYQARHFSSNKKVLQELKLKSDPAVPLWAHTDCSMDLQATFGFSNCRIEQRVEHSLLPETRDMTMI